MAKIRMKRVTETLTVSQAFNDFIKNNCNLSLTLIIDNNKMCLWN